MLGTGIGLCNVERTTTGVVVGTEDVRVAISELDSGLLEVVAATLDPLELDEA